MKRVTHNRLAFGTALLVVTLGLAMATYGEAAPTPIPNSAIIMQRVFNDCPTSTVTAVNNYPSLISVEDSNVDCFGFANLHVWRFSEDGATEANFPNNSSFRISGDFMIEGDGNGEGGLQIAPWWGEADGLFNARSTDGEVAVFGGRLPFFSFTAAFGLHYVKGTVIHMEMIYEPHALSPLNPATIEYRVRYDGVDYTSGVKLFDEGNPAEDPPHGLWGMLNDGKVGGHFKAFLGNGVPVTVKATFTNIKFETTPDANSAILHTRVFNDCPTSTLTTVNDYPCLISFDDENVDCFGFANLHVWRFSENGVDPAIFDNNAKFRFSSDFRIEGTGNGEGGLQIRPWWGEADGLFNVRSTDGEIAVFGGRLPFYTFTGVYGLHYVKGDNIHLEMVYRPHSLTPLDPATAEYRLTYNGTDYSSGPLPFDEGNPAEDPPYGLWGMLNNGQAGGHFKAFLGNGVSVGAKATFTNIHYSGCTDPVAVALDVKPHKLNLKGKSSKLTVFLTPPTGYSAGDIDPSSLRFNGVPILSDPAPKIDHNRLKVRFPRQEVLASLCIPDQLTKSKKALVPVWVNGKIGNECFDSSEIVEVKVPKVNSPHPGDVFAPGLIASVDWDLFTDEVNDPTVSLLASFDGGVTWSVQVSDIPNTGHYAWTVPNVISSTVQLRVVTVYATDEYGLINQSEYGVSDVFSIESALGVGPGSQVDLAVSAMPNPSYGLTASFSLPRSGPATLAVYDVGGRLVKSVEVGSLGPGRHTLALGAPGTLRAGVYLMRLTQGGEQRNARAVVVE